MNKNIYKILWADDEIELLRPHIIYLESKGFNLVPVKSGVEALEILENEIFDLVFLDENMPGLSGLDTLNKIKEKFSRLPVVMITKSEEESIMEEAIGSKISDYLIKPVNPNQILLSIKKNIQNSRIVEEKVTRNYQQEFRKINMLINSPLDYNSWIDVYKKIVFWELEMNNYGDDGVDEILAMQKSEANSQFFKFIKANYKNWLNDQSSPIMSHTLFKNKVLPSLKSNIPTYLVLIDNLRYDQWKMIEPFILSDFIKDSDDLYYSILPTCTQYSRNAIFSGLLPLEIQKRFPEKWKNDEDDGGKNMYEKEFLNDQLKRLGLSDFSFSYNKITNIDFGRKFVNQIRNLSNNSLNVIVYNFVDMLSHARTDMKVIKELAEDDAAYRSLTASWFEHSPLLDIIKEISKQGAKLIITTDHGTINVNKPSKVLGDKSVNSNLRYKQGKNLKFNLSDVFLFNKPNDYFLPIQNVSSKYIFAKEDLYFVYQNNYNQYVQFYRNTYQHGGVSLDEVLVPIITLSSKK